ncbi:MAG: GerMN domain-containing protein [bacterium]|nr:GerMN domain-containing protein [bacterium]MCY3924580.1 GerMN domain-containing protein [bacterium]
MPTSARRSALPGRRTMLGVVGLLAVAAACGVPQDPAPRILDASVLPEELAEPATTTTSTEAPVPRQAVSLYFVDGEGLGAPAERDLATPAGPVAALEALIAGPTEAEASGGLTSVIPAETVILSSELTNGVLRVDLAAGALEQIEGELQRLAVAQLVFTATELAGVDWLWVLIEGQPRALPTDEGDVEAPVGRVHYASLGPAGP